MKVTILREDHQVALQKNESIAWLQTTRRGRTSETRSWITLLLILAISLLIGILISRTFVFQCNRTNTQANIPQSARTPDTWPVTKPDRSPSYLWLFGGASSESLVLDDSLLMSAIFEIARQNLLADIRKEGFIVEEETVVEIQVEHGQRVPALSADLMGKEFQAVYDITDWGATIQMTFKEDVVQDSAGNKLAFSDLQQFEAEMLLSQENTENTNAESSSTSSETDEQLETELGDALNVASGTDDISLDQAGGDFSDLSWPMFEAWLGNNINDEISATEDRPEEENKLIFDTEDSTENFNELLGFSLDGYNPDSDSQNALEDI